MERYLLDTNILSDLIKNPDSRNCRPYRRSRRRTGLHQHRRRGRIAVRSCEARRRAVCGRISELLDTLEVVALEPPADRIYCELRASLERSGQLIGPNDLLIAAQALALGCTLVTDNEREFSRVENLPLENWLRQ